MASGSLRSSVPKPAEVILVISSSRMNLRARPGLGANPSGIAARESAAGNGMSSPMVIESVLMVTSGGADIKARTRKAKIIKLPRQIIDLQQHVVGGSDGLGIHFIGALGHDHVDHFLDDVDVRLFEE